MRVVLEGTGGADGWPSPGCRCASCAVATATGRARRPTAVVIDGALRIDLASPTLLHEGRGRHSVRELPGGWEITGQDGGRLLCARGAGSVPAPADGAEPYDFAVLDLLGDPTQLGALRRRGLITGSTAVALAGADHRAASEHELAEDCGFFGVQLMRDGDEMRPARDVYEWRRVLVLGGSRSGKSERAERRVAAEPEVTYVATGVGDVGDAEWAARVAAHRARRPAWWRTVETTDLAETLDGSGTLLIDGIGTWLAAVMGECGAWEDNVGWAGRLARRTSELVAAWRDTSCRVVAVSDEAGLGVIPATSAGRLFRDELGTLNQALARESEITEFVLAGRVLPLPL